MTKYRVSNWAESERALAQRGDITFWISPDAADAAYDRASTMLLQHMARKSSLRMSTQGCFRALNRGG